MGAFFSTLLQALFPSSREYKIVLLGLDNAGKTTVLYRLHLGETVTTSPTIGSNCEVVKHKNLSFEIWDLGGQANLRPAWTAYYRGADAVILVLDSTDASRLGIVERELAGLLSHDFLKQACILVLANKQDLKDAVPVADLSAALKLHSIKSHDWHIQPSCALTGVGLTEGLEWISQKVGGPATAPPPVPPAPAPSAAQSGLRGAHV